MEWKVVNALSRDVERQHLNKIFADIFKRVGEVDTKASNPVVRTNTVTNNYAVARFVLALTGDVTGSATVDGTGNVTLETTLSSSVSGVEEAPIDNQFYWRWNGEWFALPSDAAARLNNDTNIAPINFAWGDASPITIYTLRKDALVDLVQVVIRTAFDGTAPQIAVGTAGDPELLMPYAYNNPAETGTYEVSPDELLTSEDEIIITIVPGAGASAGSGQVVLSLVNT